MLIARSRLGDIEIWGALLDMESSRLIARSQLEKIGHKERAARMRPPNIAFKPRRRPYPMIPAVRPQPYSLVGGGEDPRKSGDEPRRHRLLTIGPPKRRLVP